MITAFLKLISAICILLCCANLSCFSNTIPEDSSSPLNYNFIANNPTTLSPAFDNFDFDAEKGTPKKVKKFEVIESKVEEEIKRISSDNDNFHKACFFDAFVSAKSEEISIQTSVLLAIKSFLNYTFLYKSLQIKFCSFRI